MNSSPSPSPNQNQGGSVTPVDRAPKRQTNKGKSVDYTIDALLKRPVGKEKNQEPEWGDKRTPLSDGWMWLGVLGISAVVLIAYFSMGSAKQESTENITTAAPTNEEVGKKIFTTIQQTLQGYFNADTLEKKIAFVRNPSATKPRMEKFYSSHPLLPRECLSVVRMKPFFYGDKQLWHVVAQLKDRSGVAVMVEQVGDDQFLVDWESHVDYQPMKWDDFLTQKPDDAMSFRVTVEDSPYYLHEFSDEKQWASFKLSQNDSDLMVHGYVPRDSEAHKKILAALSNGPKRIILRVKASREIVAKDSLVIQDMISDSIYRIHPPQSLND